MRTKNQLAGLCQVSKSKLKFHYFKNIFYLYFVKTYLTSSEQNLKAIQNILLTTYKIYKDKLETH